MSRYETPSTNQCWRALEEIRFLLYEDEESQEYFEVLDDTPKVIAKHLFYLAEKELE